MIEISLGIIARNFNIAENGLAAIVGYNSVIL